MKEEEGRRGMCGGWREVTSLSLNNGTTNDQNQQRLPAPNAPVREGLTSCVECNLSMDTIGTGKCFPLKKCPFSMVKLYVRAALG